MHYIIDVENREYRLLSERVAGAIPSATRITPAAAWYERELHDLYGVEIEGHPNLQPLVFHEDWPAEIHPHASPLGMRDAPQGQYRFLKVQGEGVCEVPVGPVHAGIIEPGHFRFSVVGDTVLHLELRHFYTHKGTEALFEGTPVMSGAMLAESVSGDNCFAHAVAYCQAVENAFGISVPPRGRALRLIGLELERMLAHIADVGALCGDVAFAVPASYTARLKELLLQSSARFFGTRCWRGLALPGGMRHDLTQENAHALGTIVAEVARDFAELARMILETPSVQNRFESTGILKRDLARCTGRGGSGRPRQRTQAGCPPRSPIRPLPRTLALEVPHYQLRRRAGPRAHPHRRDRHFGALDCRGARGPAGRSHRDVRSLAKQRRRIFRRRVAAWRTALLDSRARRLRSAVPHQVAVVPELARAAARHARQHHCRLSSDQQELQSFLLWM